MAMTSGETEPAETVSVVVPVFRGGATLCPLVEELTRLVEEQRTPEGRTFRVAEVLLVWDGGDTDSLAAVNRASQAHACVRPIWLSRNFGQHAATLAGVAATTSRWVVTMDEDGEHDPRSIGAFLDVAMETGAQLVYGRPTNEPPHGTVRNLLSAITKKLIIRFLMPQSTVAEFHSFRLIDGEIGRGLAAYCAYNIYLDVALSWVAGTSAHCPIELRSSRHRASAYSTHRLLSHFWRLVLTSGTRPLRAVAVLGVVAMLFAMVYSAVTIWGRITGQIPVPGYASLVIVICFFSGALMLSLGIVAEYLGMAVSVMIGRPPYLVVTRPPEARLRPSKP